MLSHHTALVHTMVLVAVADGEVTDREVGAMTEIVSFLPVFKDFDAGSVAKEVNTCLDVLQDEDGFDEAIRRIKANLPPKLCETAYALACDVAATGGGSISQEVLRVLEMIRQDLEVDRLTAAAIEKGSAVRHRVL